MATSRGSGRYSRRADGNWDATEPTHAAIVAARLHDLQGEMPPVRDRAAARAGVTPRSRPTAAVPLFRALRVRVGRVIVALGAFVEGGCDCPDGATTATRGA